MRSAKFDVSNDIHLALPKTYIDNFGTSEIQILNESLPSGLCVRWDDACIQFINYEGAVSYRRSAIENFWVDYKTRIYGSNLCELVVSLSTTGMMVLYCHQPHREEFDGCIEAMLAAEVPISIAGRRS